MVEQNSTQSRVWAAVLVTAALLFSFALACGMPFAALGAIAALTLPLREAMRLAGIGWLTNQLIGFGFLGYPLDVMTFAWGAALGMSALAAALAAHVARRHFGNSPPAPLFTVVFLAAWGAQQSTVLAWTFVLGGTASAFAPHVVWFILWTNASAFAVLLGVQFIGALAGMARVPHSRITI